MFYGSQNDLQDTIGHEENGCLAHGPTDESPRPNVEEIVCACIGACAPSRERVPAKKSEGTLVQGVVVQTCLSITRQS